MFAKKNLVAAAALLALAGAAQAQVKLYGMVDMSVGSFETAGGDRTTEIASGRMMTSYFGLSGSEDLGGGLKAEFVLESFLAADTGANVTNNAGNFWGRGSWVGLSGGFGRVALGQYDNPLFASGYLYNPFGSSMYFSPTMRHYYGIFGNAFSLGFDTGFVNSVTYETPNMGGFMGTVQFSPKESSTAGRKNSYSAAVNYTAGPLSAQLTYVKGGVSDVTGTPPNTFQAYKEDEKVWSVGASYDFGVAKAFGQYTDVDDKTNGQDDKIYQIGVSVPLSDKASVMASFGQLKRDESGSTLKDKVFSLGYGYALSKRTDVYGVFTNNQTTGEDSGQTFAVGIRHNF